MGARLREKAGSSRWTKTLVDELKRDVEDRARRGRSKRGIVGSASRRALRDRGARRGMDARRPTQNDTCTSFPRSCTTNVTEASPPFRFAA